MGTDLVQRLSDQSIRVEILYSFDGKPRIWGDGSEVKMIVDGCGAIDWAQTAEVNPWILKHCYARGYNVEVELKRKFREQKCLDCDVLPGEAHEPGCEVESCVRCGGQKISCACLKEDAYHTEIQELGGVLPWTGIPVGAKEAIEYGFWRKWSLIAPHDGNNLQTSGWICCSASDQGARPDLDRVGEECFWDKTKRRWLKRQTNPTETSEAG